MIVVLCDTWEDAKDAFNYFIKFLHENGLRRYIRKVQNACYSLTTKAKKYIFVCYEVQTIGLLEGPQYEFIDEGTFFNQTFEEIRDCYSDL